MTTNDKMKSSWPIYIDDKSETKHFVKTDIRHLVIQGILEIVLLREYCMGNLYLVNMFKENITFQDNLGN